MRFLGCWLNPPFYHSSNSNEDGNDLSFLIQDKRNSQKYAPLDMDGEDGPPIELLVYLEDSSLQINSTSDKKIILQRQKITNRQITILSDSEERQNQNPSFSKTAILTAPSLFSLESEDFSQEIENINLEGPESSQGLVNNKDDVVEYTIFHVNQVISMFGRVFKLTSCDPFTKSYLKRNHQQQQLREEEQQRSKSNMIVRPSTTPHGSVSFLLDTNTGRNNHHFDDSFLLNNNNSSFLGEDVVEQDQHDQQQNHQNEQDNHATTTTNPNTNIGFMADRNGDELLEFEGLYNDSSLYGDVVIFSIIFNPTKQTLKMTNKSSSKLVLKEERVTKSLEFVSEVPSLKTRLLDASEFISEDDLIVGRFIEIYGKKIKLINCSPTTSKWYLAQKSFHQPVLKSSNNGGGGGKSSGRGGTTKQRSSFSFFFLVIFSVFFF